MEAAAKYDFKATADDELSFKRGDILKVSKVRAGGQGRVGWLHKEAEVALFRLSPKWFWAPETPSHHSPDLCL